MHLDLAGRLVVFVRSPEIVDNERKEVFATRFERSAPGYYPWSNRSPFPSKKFLLRDDYPGKQLNTSTESSVYDNHFLHTSGCSCHEKYVGDTFFSLKLTVNGMVAQI